MRVGYLGPEGTFTHETAEMAAAKLGWQNIEYVPIATSVGVVEALARGEVDVAVVVDSTSLSGPMPEVNKAIEVAGVRRLDHIQRVCHYHLLAPPGAALDKLTGIVAHAKATGDCRATLARIAPGLPFTTTTSTGAGVKRVADEGRLDQAAIGTATAGRLYGLVALAENIEDDPENWTGWAVLGVGS
jgi:prephenate dehydratase